MIITEQEAKTKRCQEAFPAAYGLSKDGEQSHPVATHSVPGPVYAGAIGGAGYAVYSEPTGGAPFHCLGGACMAWQWSKIWSENNELVQERTLDGSALGYCGKAHR